MRCPTSTAMTMSVEMEIEQRRMTIMNVTFNRIGNGEFEVLKNGEKTKYRIYNGSRGLSGRDTRNEYGIHSGASGLYWRIGTLAAAKKTVTVWLTRET